MKKAFRIQGGLRLYYQKTAIRDFFLTFSCHHVTMSSSGHVIIFAWLPLLNIKESERKREEREVGKKVPLNTIESHSALHCTLQPSKTSL